MPLPNFIRLEIWFTEVGRNLGGTYLEPAERFRPILLKNSISALVLVPPQN